MDRGSSNYLRGRFFSPSIQPIRNDFPTNFPIIFIFRLIVDRGSIVFERFSNFIFIFRLIEDRGSSNYLRERFFSPSTRFQPIRNDFPINFPIIFIFRLSVDRGSIISERFSNFIFTFRLIKDRGSVRSSNYFDIPFAREIFLFRIFQPSL